jgi:hypothetical protein
MKKLFEFIQSNDLLVRGRIGPPIDGNVENDVQNSVERKGHLRTKILFEIGLVM